MFQSTRIKLTLWYLFIIMVVSILFSLIVYQSQVGEPERLFQRLQARIERNEVPRPPFNFVSQNRELFEEAKNILIRNLILINFGVLIFSGIGGYLLAGRTLKPIEDMMDDQSRFIADASHELRTPLTSLKTELEVNLRSKTLEKNARKVLASNLEEVNKLTYLSDKLLHLSLYNQDKELEFNTIEISSVLDSVVHQFEKVSKLKNISIKSNFQKINIKGNEESLFEAFGTLVDNALKYSPKGKDILIETFTKGNYAVATIKDSGIGIKASEVPYIFNRFYRADSSRSKEKTDGFGLGLSIAKSIIDKHKGKIEVETKPESGTTFIVKLPLSKI